METREWVALAGFVVLTAAAAVAAVLGQGEGVEAYYRSLALPDWAPSARVFGPVWAVLYLLVAVSAWVRWRNGGWRGASLKLWVTQLLLIPAWPYVFFGQRDPGLALSVILLHLFAVVATAIAFAKRSRLAAVLFTPYVLWIGYLTASNGALWWTRLV